MVSLQYPTAKCMTCTYQFCNKEKHYSMCNTYYTQTTDAIKE